MLRVLKSVAVVLKKMLLLPLKQECPYLLWSDRDAWLSHRNPPDLVYACFCPCISWKKSLWPFGEPPRWPSSCCPLCSPVLWHCPGFLMPWIPAHFQGPQIELLEGSLSFSWAPDLCFKPHKLWLLYNSPATLDFSSCSPPWLPPSTPCFYLIDLPASMLYHSKQLCSHEEYLSAEKP